MYMYIPTHSCRYEEVLVQEEKRETGGEEQKELEFLVSCTQRHTSILPTTWAVHLFLL